MLLSSGLTFDPILTRFWPDFEISLKSVFFRGTKIHTKKLSFSCASRPFSHWFSLKNQREYLIAKVFSMSHWPDSNRRFFLLEPLPGLEPGNFPLSSHLPDSNWGVLHSWSHWADSNRRPTHYECVALPTEPQWQASFFESGCKGNAFFWHDQIKSQKNAK